MDKAFDNKNSKESLESFTGLLFSHERHDYLVRAITYYSTAPFVVRIYDSSNIAYDGYLPDNISYFHCPRQGAWQRYMQSVDSIETTYWGLLTDDDFISKKGVTRGIAFLDAHKDYASVQGKCVGYLTKNNVFTLKTLNALVYFMDVSSDCAQERIKQSFFPYKDMSFAVHRKEVSELFKGLDADRMPANHFGELKLNACSSIIGKHKIMSYLGMVKEFIQVDTPSLNSVMTSEELKPRVDYLVGYIANNWIKNDDSITYEQACKSIVSGFELCVFKHYNLRGMLSRSGYDTPEMYFPDIENNTIPTDMILAKFQECAAQYQGNTLPILDNESLDEFCEILNTVLDDPCRLFDES